MKDTILLTREALLERDELKIEKVELTRGHVYVREMTGLEKDVWEKSITKKLPSTDSEKPANYEMEIEGFRAKLAVVTVCDEQGNLLFSIKDYGLLNRSMSAINMDKIVEVASRLNAITKKDKEEMLKNLKADQENSSNSGSAEN